MESQSWQQHVETEFTSGQASIRYLKFTPPISEDSNSTAPETLLVENMASTNNSDVPWCRSTPHGIQKKRIRRTKLQISQGVSLDELKQTINN